MNVRPWVLGIGVAAMALGGIALVLKPPQRAQGLTPENSAAATTLDGGIAGHPLRLLVIGGTSGIGLETVKLALSRGHTVTAMARRAPADLSPHPRLRFVAGSIDDPVAVDAALRDQDVVVVSIGLPPSRRPTRVLSSGVAHLVEGLRSAGRGRLLVVTGIGAGDSRGHGGFGHDHVILPLLLRTIYADKDATEAALRESSVAWTIVRPGFLVDGPSTGRYSVVGALDGVRAGSIARSDVAHYLVGIAERGSDARRTVLLTR